MKTLNVNFPEICIKKMNCKYELDIDFLNVDYRLSPLSLNCT